MISRTNRTARISWSIAYVFFFLAGIVAFFTPLKTIDGALVKVLVYSWAMFMTVGGGLSLGGKLRNTWAGEIIGLPALCAANYVLSVILLTQGTSIGSIIFSGIFFGIGTAFVGRWIELYNLSRHNLGGEE